MPTLIVRLFWLVLTAPGAAVLALALVALFCGTPVIGLGILAVGVLLAWPGWRGLTGRIGAKKIRFDRAGGAGSVKGKLPAEAGGGRKLLHASMAAVQLCSSYVASTSSGGTYHYAADQTNLVLRDPPGVRTVRMNHAGGERVRADARRLAEFLDVPLLDHA